MSMRPIQRASRRGVDLGATGAVDIRRADTDALAPWLIQAASPNVDLATWANDSDGLPERKLLETGAIVFRGFGLETAEDFERAAATLTSALYDGYGDLPREGSSRNIYKSTPYPPDQPILFHNESSHLSRWPMRILFFCLVPAAEGGETPMADCREIARRLEPDVFERFRSKGLMYVRNFTGLDVSWQQFFQTEERAEVERTCRDQGTEFEWGDADTLRIRERTEAVRQHPVSGETLFFNQIQLHHPYFLEPEVRESLRSMFAEEDLPRNVLYGDGTGIEDDVAQHVLQTYWDTCVMYPWEKGDVIMLDNMLIAHARMPFAGERRIAVAMAGMTTA